MENKKILIWDKHPIDSSGPTLEVVIKDYGKNYQKECPTCKHIGGPENRIDYSVPNSQIRLFRVDYNLNFSKIKNLCNHLEEEFYLENEEFSKIIRNDDTYLEKKVTDYLRFDCEFNLPSKWYSLEKNKIGKKESGIAVKMIFLEEVIDSKNNHILDKIFIELYPKKIYTSDGRD